MKRTERNLDDMLGLVRENHPAKDLFSSSDVQRMIAQEQNSTPTLKVGQRRPGSFITQYRPYILMTFIAALILTGALLFQWEKPNLTQQTETPLLHNGNLRNGDPGQSSSPRSTTPPKGQRSMLFGQQEKEGKKRAEAVADSNTIAGILLSGMTDEELRRVFGIQFADGTTEIPANRTIQTEGLPLPILESLSEYGYDTTLPSLSVHMQGVIDIAPGSVSGSTKLSGPQSKMLIATPVAAALLEDAQNNSTIMLSLADDNQLERIGVWSEQLTQEIQELSEPQESTAQRSVLSRMIAVQIPRSDQDTEGKTINRNIVVWYIPTPELVAALPARYRTPTVTALANARYPKRAPQTQEEREKRLIPGVLKFTSRYTTDQHKTSLTKFDDKDISGIHFLDLTRNELEQIGINVNDTGIAFTMEQQFERMDPETRQIIQELGYDAGNASANVGFRVTADTFSMDYRTLTQQEMTATTLKPVLYSGRWIKPEGNEGLSMIFTTKAPVLNKLGEASENLKGEVFDAYDNNSTAINYQSLNKLIPVRIGLESNQYIEPAEKNSGGEILLWYVPTQEFVNALPDRYRIALENELKIIASVEEANLTSDEVCRQMAGENVILDVCRSGSGAISYTRAWPNPARQTIALHYVLTQPRRVAITLHDLAGKFLKEMANYTPRTPGTYQENVNLEGIESGTYLVTIRTDKGEQGVQRIVVE